MPILAVFALGSCSVGGFSTNIIGRAEIYSFEYRPVRVTSAVDYGNQLRADPSRLADGLGPTPCRYSPLFADYVVVNGVQVPVTRPRARLGGRPGIDSILTIFSAAQSVNTEKDTNPSTCIEVTGTSITIGKVSNVIGVPNQPFDVGTPIDVAGARITLEDGRDYSVNGFFNATVDNIVGTNRRVSGRFQFYSYIDGNSREGILGEGAFHMRY